MRVLLSFVFISFCGILSGQNDMEWLLNKAIRLVEYKEKEELSPVINQLTELSNLQNIPVDDDASRDIIAAQIAVLNQKIIVEPGQEFSFSEMGKALYRIKYQLALVNLRKILKLNDDEFQTILPQIASNIESLSTSAISFEMDPNLISKFQRAENFFRNIKIGMVNNKKLKKGRGILTDTLMIASKVKY